MKKRIALVLGSMALFGLMSTASAAVTPSYTSSLSSLGKCGDPGMIASPACNKVAREAGLNMAQRNKIADHIECSAIAEQLGQYALTKTTKRTRQEI